MVASPRQFQTVDEYITFQNHIGFYPTPSGIEAFKEELSGYEGAKGSIQFPIDQPLPLTLIRRIVEHRIKENLARKQMKKSSKNQKGEPG